MLTAIVGINWGDEGKGRMVDLLSESYDMVVRYQGGNNAGHTVVNERGKFILNLLPSGILRPDVVNVMGNGMVIDIRHLAGEIGRLRDAGVKITPENLKISDRAIICMPYDVQQDCLEEDRLRDRKFGSTRRGISPVYADKYFKKGIQMGRLPELGLFEEQLAGIVEWKNLFIEKGYGAPRIELSEMLDYLHEYGDPLKEYICDTGLLLNNAAAEGKRIMFEAQLGALRDIDFGIYPFTSSSNTIAAYAPIGSGVPNLKLDCTVGIMKAYSSCVGEGPFAAELAMTEEEKHLLREAGHEYGAATGRPRRVGPFDVVASRYGVQCQGADELALTLLDVLGYMEEIPVVAKYLVNGEETDEFPMGKALDDAKPVVKKMPGWHCDISGCRTWESLPEEARRYVEYIENAVGAHIKYVSVGADRDAYLVRE